MPAPKKPTSTVEQLLQTYTPLTLTPLQWNLIAPDLRFLVRAANPPSCNQARTLLWTACRFIGLLSRDGRAVTVAEAFTYQQVARYRALAAGNGQPTTSLDHADSVLASLLTAHLGLPPRPAWRPVEHIEPLGATEYEAAKSSVRADEHSSGPLSRSQLKAAAAVLKTLAPGVSPQRLRVAWVLDVLSGPGSFRELNAHARLNRHDLRLAWPHLQRGTVDLSRLRDGR